jgi:hypothetical protein
MTRFLVELSDLGGEIKPKAFGGRGHEEEEEEEEEEDEEEENEEENEEEENEEKERRGVQTCSKGSKRRKRVGKCTNLGAIYSSLHSSLH